MWRMPRIIKLTQRLYTRSKYVKKICRQCETDLKVGIDVVTKHSHSSLRTLKRSTTHWYHVDCAKRLNII